MVSELQRTWKEAVMPNYTYYLGICLEGMRKIRRHLRIVDVWARPEHNPEAAPFESNCSVDPEYI
jgi:hypothetical protein